MDDEEEHDDEEDISILFLFYAHSIPMLELFHFSNHSLTLLILQPPRAKINIVYVEKRKSLFLFSAKCRLCKYATEQTDLIYN